MIFRRFSFVAAMGFLRPNTVREGKKYLPDKNVDVHFITLNKAEKDCSHTTMYEDYFIIETLFQVNNLAGQPNRSALHKSPFNGSA